MALLEDVKMALRISHNALDDDIQNNIDSALEDMARVGIANCIEGATTKLQDKCIELYIKGIYDYEGKGDRWNENYEKLRNQLSLSTVAPHSYEIQYVGADITLKLNHYLIGITDLTATDYEYNFPYVTLYASYLSTLTETTVLTYQTLHGDGIIAVVGA